MKRPKIALLSLGCARNLVDAEVLLGHLQKGGFFITDEIEGVAGAFCVPGCFPQYLTKAILAYARATTRLVMPMPPEQMAKP